MLQESKDWIAPREVARRKKVDNKIDNKSDNQKSINMRNVLQYDETKERYKVLAEIKVFELVNLELGTAL